MSTKDFTYDQIKPLIISAEQSGNQMKCQFALPGSEEIFDAVGAIQRSTGIGSQVTRQVKRQALNQARRALTRTLSSVFGGGFLGRTVRSAATTASRQPAQSMVNAASKSEKEAAIVAAFNRVSAQFQYDETEGKWRKASSSSPKPKTELSPFSQLLQTHPIQTKFEQNVLARLLTQVAYADGELSNEEKSFFEETIPEEFGTIESLASSDPVSAVEAEELSAPVKQSIYALAWAISSIDMDASAQEEALLKEYSSKFSLSPEKAEELEKKAKFYVLESYLSESMDRQELFEMGAKLGLSEEEAERCKARWMKRQ